MNDVRSIQNTVKEPLNTVQDAIER